jgi:hypothetical protein
MCVSPQKGKKLKKNVESNALTRQKCVIILKPQKAGILTIWSGHPFTID